VQRVRSPELSCWQAEAGGTVLTATRLAVDRWQPKAGDRRGPVCRNRLAAQRWAEDQVRGAG
jgi:hypothetical protein